MPRMMLLLSAYVQLSNLQMQQAALRFFMQLYSDREAWSFHHQYNEFDVYFASDLNTNKDRDLECWRKHYRMSRETFHYTCSLYHENDTKLRDRIPFQKELQSRFGGWRMENHTGLLVKHLVCLPPFKGILLKILLVN